MADICYKNITYSFLIIVCFLMRKKKQKASNLFAIAVILSLIPIFLNVVIHTVISNLENPPTRIFTPVKLADESPRNGFAIHQN